MFLWHAIIHWLAQTNEWTADDEFMWLEVVLLQVINVHDLIIINNLIIG